MMDDVKPDRGCQQNIYVQNQISHPKPNLNLNNKRLGKYVTGSFRRNILLKELLSVAGYYTAVDHWN